VQQQKKKKDKKKPDPEPMIQVCLQTNVTAHKCNVRFAFNFKQFYDVTVLLEA